MTLAPRTLLVATLALVLAACDKPGDRVEIADTAPRSDTRPVPQVNVSSADRFTLASPQTTEPATSADASGAPTDPQMAPAAQAAGAASGGDGGMFEYQVPAGWTQTAASQFRDPNFTIGPNAEIECYVSVLQGQGGGMLVNANRWRNQLGQPAYTDDDFAKLPHATILGRDARIVEFTGDYLAMGAAAPKSGYRLVGALVEAPMAAIFIKMVGPDAMVQNEKDNFAIFAQSLRMRGPQSATAGAAAPAQAPAVAPMAAATDAAFTWTAPEGWTEGAGSQMRLVTYKFGAQNEGECYIAALPGSAGGRLENFNRWLGQMGEPPLTDTELPLQPPVNMFGEEVPMLIAKGTYAGMGGESRPGYALFGALAEVDGQSVFVKLVAPEALASENMQKFAVFCASIKKK